VVKTVPSGAIVLLLTDVVAPTAFEHTAKVAFTGQQGPGEVAATNGSVCIAKGLLQE